MWVVTCPRPNGNSAIDLRGVNISLDFIDVRGFICIDGNKWHAMDALIVVLLILQSYMIGEDNIFFARQKHRQMSIVLV